MEMDCSLKKKTITYLLPGLASYRVMRDKVCSQEQIPLGLGLAAFELQQLPSAGPWAPLCTAPMLQPP